MNRSPPRWYPQAGPIPPPHQTRPIKDRRSPGPVYDRGPPPEWYRWHDQHRGRSPPRPYSPPRANIPPHHPVVQRPPSPRADRNMMYPSNSPHNDRPSSPRSMQNFSRRPPSPLRGSRPSQERPLSPRRERFPSPPGRPISPQRERRPSPARDPRLLRGRQVSPPRAYPPPHDWARRSPPPPHWDRRSPPRFGPPRGRSPPRIPWGPPPPGVDRYHGPPPPDRRSPPQWDRRWSSGPPPNSMPPQERYPSPPRRLEPPPSSREFSPSRIDRHESRRERKKDERSDESESENDSDSDRLKEYNPAVPTGQGFVMAVSGYFCKVCHKFYNSEVTAKISHCKTKNHYDKFSKWLSEQQVAYLVRKRLEAAESGDSDKTEWGPPAKQVKLEVQTTAEGGRVQRKKLPLPKGAKYVMPSSAQPKIEPANGGLDAVTTDIPTEESNEDQASDNSDTDVLITNEGKNETSGGPEATLYNLRKLKVNELKANLEKRGMKATGLKPLLLKRLEKVLRDEAAENGPNKYNEEAVGDVEENGGG